MRFRTAARRGGGGLIAATAAASIVLAVMPARHDVVATAQAPSSVTIYSSLPLQGDSRRVTQDVVNAEKLALAEAGGRGGGIPIHFVSLDDATAAAGKWDPGQVFANAREAAQDNTTIAYLGEFNSGGSAISIPVLNEAGIPQVSPSNTYVGLTRSRGGDRGEPDKYYPTGVRTYVRVAPADHLQAAALAKYMRLRGVRRLFVLDDREIYGRGIARLVRARARHEHIRVVGAAGIDRFGDVGRALRRRIKRSRADAMFFGGITDNGAPTLFNTLHRLRPRLKLFGPDGVAEESFTRRLTKGTRARTRITDPALNRRAYQAAARSFVRRFRAKYHHTPSAYGVYGYEAMSLVLDAMNRAAPHANDRQAVLAVLFATRDRTSVLGRYSIDSNGDTTLPLYTGYKVSREGHLRYDRTIHAGL
jgi:branched-chain amino acid transport system substrate-binding protein